MTSWNNFNMKIRITNVLYILRDPKLKHTHLHFLNEKHLQKYSSIRNSNAMLSAFYSSFDEGNSPEECNADIKCIEYRMILHFESDAIYSAAFSVFQSIWRNLMRALCRLHVFLAVTGTLPKSNFYRKCRMNIWFR